MHRAGFPAGYPYHNDSYCLEKDKINAEAGSNVLFAGNDGSENNTYGTAVRSARLCGRDAHIEDRR